MKKLFFFRSNSGNNSQASLHSADKKTHSDKSVEKSRINKHGYEKAVGTTPCLRKSLSLSSGSVHDMGKDLRNHVEQNGFPCKQSNHPSLRSRTLTPEKQTRAKYSHRAIVDNTRRVEKSDCFSSRPYSDLSETSSYCSSSVSSKVLDRYIDGEQQTRSSELKDNFTLNNQIDNGNVVVKRFPHDSRKQKPKSQSFGESKLSQLHLLSRTSGDNGFDHKSPRRLAREVIERLSQSQLLPEMRAKEFYLDSPITIEDIYSQNMNRYPTAYTDGVAQGNCMDDWHGEFEQPHRRENRVQVRENSDASTEIDLELLKKLKEAKERATLLSEKLEQENFLEVRGLSLQILVQIIRSLAEDKVNMAMEVATVLQDRVAENSLFVEKFKLASAELDSQARRLGKEKNELQVALEKELDRRSIEWSFKLEKYQTEEHRLRERIRELAEQNVSLQREVSSFNERETESRTKIISSEKELEGATVQVKEAREENQLLQKKISEILGKFRSAEEDRNCIRKNFEEKVTECKDMHQTISRLQRTCSDQEKTIDGLRGFCEELGEKISHENFNIGLARLQMEQMRLTGVEHALRKEVESSRVEIDSLRCENINLLNRLKNNGNQGTFSTLKLDQELHNRISSLQDHVLPLLTNSAQTFRKLLENIKSNSDYKLKKGLNIGTSVDDHILECEVELQGLERAAENMTSSTHTVSNIFHEKLHLGDVESQLPGLSNESTKGKDAKSKDAILSELKAETLLTSLLREKLYSKELGIEQLKSELAESVRSNEILKCEVQNALDKYSCINHQMKDLELQMMKKDEAIKQLECDLQERKKELAIVKGILPKVTEERDVMWEEIKKYSESNMLLNSEIKAMGKKIEALDEEILLKEGQISILKDSMMHKPFDLLASPGSTNNFCWKDSC